MKSIALIHTVQSVLVSFELMLRDKLPYDVEIHNILDDYLASEPDKKGYVSAECKKILYTHIDSAQAMQSDLIVVTCSAMTPTVTQVRPFISTPLLAIDDAMVQEAVARSNNISAMATATSSAGTTTETLFAEASRQGKVVKIRALDNQDAFEAMQRGDMETHDNLVKQQASTISFGDIIVLAQASMAHLEQDIAKITGRNVLTSPKLCIEKIRSMLL
jgi:Asp/Glu/hydantoin racemase